MIPIHGTPITPKAVLATLPGEWFCVSFIRPDNLKHCFEIGAGVMLDNGAFSAWRRGIKIEWRDYYNWVEIILGRHDNVWPVIPDVIDGTAEDNDRLIDEWPLGKIGAPVWHMHEPIERLLRLAREWPKVCIGSSSVYRRVASPLWTSRIIDAMNQLCGAGPPPCRLHLLRGLQMAGSDLPLYSGDSTDIGRNHNRPQNTAARMAARWRQRQCPDAWVPRNIGGSINVCR